MPIIPTVHEKTSATSIVNAFAEHCIHVVLTLPHIVVEVYLYLLHIQAII